MSIEEPSQYIYHELYDTEYVESSHRVPETEWRPLVEVFINYTDKWHVDIDLATIDAMVQNIYYKRDSCGDVVFALKSPNPDYAQAMEWYNARLAQRERTRLQELTQAAEREAQKWHDLAFQYKKQLDEHDAG